MLLIAQGSNLLDIIYKKRTQKDITYKIVIPAVDLSETFFLKVRGQHKNLFASTEISCLF